MTRFTPGTSLRESAETNNIMVAVKLTAIVIFLIGSALAKVKGKVTAKASLTASVTGY